MAASAHAAGRALECREAFEEFYVRTAPALRGYLRRVAGDAALADDILQESYIRLLGAPPLDEASLKPYLYRTATNLIADHWRRLNRERAWFKSVIWPSEAPPARLDFANDIERLFSLLKLRERSLLWLAYVEGACHREIAAVLSLREKSVRVLLARARRRWEEILAAHGYHREVRP